MVIQRDGIDQWERIVTTTAQTSGILLIECGSASQFSTSSFSPTAKCPLRLRD